MLIKAEIGASFLNYPRAPNCLKTALFGKYQGSVYSLITLNMQCRKQTNKDMFTLDIYS